jgi:hypothetical protein
MKIILKEGKSASKEAVQKLEAALGCPISDSFRRFVSENDGSEPESNQFKIGDDNGAAVNRFIPVSEILEERQYIDNCPSQAYPIAWASCGNYVLLDEGEGGKVYFWDHEFEDENITELADNFDAFLSMVEPFDLDSIKLEPGQVKSVWIDPEFQKFIDEQKKNKR